MYIYTLFWKSDALFCFANISATFQSKIQVLHILQFLTTKNTVRLQGRGIWDAGEACTFDSQHIYSEGQIRIALRYESFALFQFGLANTSGFCGYKSKLTHKYSLN